jgi:hypothetical protein
MHCPLAMRDLASSHARRLETLARPLLDRTLAVLRRVLRDAGQARRGAGRRHGRRLHAHADGAPRGGALFGEQGAAPC